MNPLTGRPGKKGRKLALRLPRWGRLLTHSPTKSCAVCQVILDAFKPAVGDFYSTNLGTPNEVLYSSKCDVHRRLITHLFNEEVLGSQIREITITRNELSVRVWAEVSGEVLSIPGFSDIQLLPSAETSSYLAEGKVLNPQWIEPSILQRWKDKCDRSHARTCLESLPASLPQHPGPSSLVDTHRQCLVSAEPRMTYVALSYVWGNFSNFRTIRSNANELGYEGALARTINIPSTVREAFGVTKLLRERNLWVDSLCIVQDDDEGKHDQINSMGSIYAKSSVTIVAWEGEDANFGLRGFEGISADARTTTQEIFQLAKGLELITSDLSRLSLLQKTTSWPRRGWTFQEHMLSRRRVIFRGDRVEWECPCARWYEGTAEIDQENVVHHHIVGGQEIFKSRYPDLGGYNEIVMHYNEREFSYPEDCLRAFAGVTSILSRTFEEGFICGLPALFFDVGLL